MRSPNICSSDSLNMIPSSSIQAVVKCKVFSLLTAESGSFCISGSISWLTPSSVLQYLVVTRLLQGELWLNINMQFVFAAGCFCVLGRDANKKNHRVISSSIFAFPLPVSEDSILTTSPPALVVSELLETGQFSRVCVVWIHVFRSPVAMSILHVPVGHRLYVFGECQISAFPHYWGRLVPHC